MTTLFDCSFFGKMLKVKEPTKKKLTKTPQASSPKEASLRLLHRIDNDATFDDIIYEFYVVQKATKGIRELDEGRVISHEEVRKQILKR